MTKVGDPTALADALVQVWNMALAPSPSESDAKYLSPRKEEYWDRPVKMLRRIESEAPADAA